MARIRSVKPSLRTSQVVSRWPMEVRYFFVLLWGYLDDLGRGLDIPKTISGDCFPRDDKVTAATIDKWLTLMATTKAEPDRDPPVCRYEVGGNRYVHCVYWSEHQRPNRPSPSQHPPCPVHESFTESLSEPLTASRSEGALSPQVLELEGLTEGEVEGAAREPGSESPGQSPLGPEPSRRCRDHLEDPDPPACRRCRAARERWEGWHAANRARLFGAAKCPAHRGQLVHNCASCRADALAARSA